MKSPNLEPREMKLGLEYANKLLGLNLTAKETKELLERMRYGVSVKGRELEVLIPPYRTDVLHPIDLVEDVAIAYGYERFEPEIPKIYTQSSRDPLEKFSTDLRMMMIGFGFQEVVTLIMTGKSSLFGKMLLGDEAATETQNPVSEEHSVCRTWLLPSLLSVLEKNRNQEYPQRIFEAGDCVTPDGKSKRKLSAVAAHSSANFSEIKAMTTGVLESLNLKYDVKPHEHPSFISGRCAATDYGFFGELHPKVLGNFGLEIPVAALELDAGKLSSR